MASVDYIVTQDEFSTVIASLFDARCRLYFQIDPTGTPIAAPDASTILGAVRSTTVLEIVVKHPSFAHDLPVTRQIEGPTAQWHIFETNVGDGDVRLAVKAFASEGAPAVYVVLTRGSFFQKTNGAVIPPPKPLSDLYNRTTSQLRRLCRRTGISTRKTLGISKRFLATPSAVARSAFELGAQSLN